MILDQIIQKKTKNQKKQQQNNQKPALIVCDFYGPDKELFDYWISTDQTVQKY